jgi:hypothetical protein
MVFLLAGVAKLRNVTLFATDIRGYQLLPEWLVMPLATYLPLLEIVVGGALLLRVAYGGALLLSGMLCGMFPIALGSAIWRGLDIHCGCFGHADNRPLSEAFAMDAMLLGAWFWLALYLFRTRLRSEETARSPVDWAPELDGSRLNATEE